MWVRHGLALLLLPGRVGGNWLLQCTSCIDQAYYSDSSQKSHVAPANTSDLYNYINRLGLHVYDHKHDEFFNKFFSRSQLGLDPADVKLVLPGAISTLPERRWTAANGTVIAMKNVDLVRDSQVMLSMLGGLQEMIRRFEMHADEYNTWTVSYTRLVEDMRRALDDMVKEQAYARRKREEMVEQIVRAVATAELAQKNLARTEGRITDLREIVTRTQRDQEEHKGLLANATEHLRKTLQEQDQRLLTAEHNTARELERFKDLWSEGLAATSARMDKADGRSTAIEEAAVALGARLDGDVKGLRAQERELRESLERAWKELEKEASADVVERRRIAEADVELALTKMQHDKMRYDEEKAAVQLKHAEQRASDDHANELERKRAAEELAGKAAHEKEMLDLNEASQRRINAETFDAEKERLQLQLQLDREKAELELKASMEKARIDAEAKIRDKRDNADVYMSELEAQAAADRAKLLAAIAASVEHARKSLQELYSRPENLVWAVGSIVALFAGIYLSREMATLAREQLNKRLGRPSLVRRTSRRSIFGDILRAISRIARRCCGCALRPERVFDDVILAADLHKQIMRVANAARTAKSRKAQLLNIMFYGPPGTGKTMVAERFAEYSGLEYAIMAGGDVAPLEDQAVTELHKLFKWVHTSRRGVLLFIDEADAFLSSRNKGNMSEHLRNALTTMLYHTGSPSKQFMLVLATNRPGDLDPAIIDRIDEAVEFPLPDVGERTKLVKQYYTEHLGKAPLVASPAGKQQADTAAGKATTDALPTDDVFQQVAHQLRGFSGREINKLCMALQTHIFAELGHSRGRKQALQPTAQMLFEVVDKKVREHNKAIEFLAHGYQHQAPVPTPTPSPAGNGKNPYYRVP